MAVRAIVGGGITSEQSRILANRKPFIKRIGVIGSSLTAQQTVYGSASSYISYETRGWLPMANMMLGGRIIADVWQETLATTIGQTTTITLKGFNKGISGQYSETILARVADVDAINPDAVIVQIATNDYSDLIGHPYQTSENNTRAVYEHYLNRGIMVIALAEFNRTLTPTSWGAGQEARHKWARMNQWRRDYCRENAHRGIIYVDPNKYLTDHASTAGAPYAGMFITLATDSTIDGTHLTPNGCYAAARAVAEVLAPLVPPTSPFVFSQANLYDATYNPRGNFLTNGLFTGTGGSKGTGVTGTVADGWNIARTTGSANVVASLVANPAGGYFQQAVITPSGAAQLESIYIITTPAVSAITLPDQAWIKGYAQIEIDAGQTCLYGVSYNIKQTNGVEARSFNPYNLTGANGQYPFPDANVSLLQQTPHLKVNSPYAGSSGSHDLYIDDTYTWTDDYIGLASGNLNCRTRIDMKGDGGGSVTVRMGQAGVFQVDDPNLTWTL